MVRADEDSDAAASSSDAQAPEAEKDALGKTADRRAVQDNDAVDSEQEELASDSRARRPRHQSDAERQNHLERQRETTRTERIRSSLTNNRFLSKKQPPQLDESRPEHDGDAIDTRPEQKQRMPQDERDSSEDGTTSDPPPPAGLVVVAPKRSSIAASAVRTGASNQEDAITYPPVHLLPGVALRRSKWTHEIADEESCGLFVDDKRAHLRTIHPSTLVRLEERLRRENSSASEASRPALHLTDLIHTRKASARRSRSFGSETDDQVLEDAFGAARTDSRASSKARAARRSNSTAMLEISIDRIVLDDHESFALEDRISAQLRSLYASYGQLQQQQPWQIHLDRVSAFVDAFCVSTGNARKDVGATETSAAWKTQVVNEAELALNELTKLQLLHQQLLGKWSELQECGRQSSRDAALPYRIHSIERGDPIDLERLHALVEILSDSAKASNGDDKRHELWSGVSSSAIAHLADRLEALEVQDKCLRHVLRVESQHHTHAHAVRGTRETLFASRPRKFYVAIYVNGKQAFATKAQLASDRGGRLPQGLVLFDETCRLRVPFFPESVAAKVFEQGLVRATALSTTSIPIVLPGQSARADGEESTTGGSELQIPVASLAPSSEWYQFSSTRPIARARWHRSFLNSSLYVNFTRHPHGRVHITTAWIAPDSSGRSTDGSRLPSSESSAIDSELTCYLPLKRPPLVRALLKNDRAQIIGRRVPRCAGRHTREEDNRSGFSYERDFLVHMKALDSALDPNDPDNASAMRLQRHLRAQSAQLATRDVFRTSALALGDSELFGCSASLVSTQPLTKRNLLLQLRDREHAAKHGTSTCDAPACRRDAVSSRGAIEASRWQHEVFEDPVPLDESEIVANDKYLALLRPEVRGYDRRLRVEDAEEGDAFSIERQQKRSLLKIHDFIDRVKQHQLVAKRTSDAKERTKTLASIIQEQPLPLFPGTLDLSGLANLFAPRRRLRPQAAKRSAPTALAEWPNVCDLYVQVQKAANVPVRLTQRGASGIRGLSLKSRARSTAQPGSSSKRPGDAGDRGLNEDSEARSPPRGYDSQVFVEICFQGKKRRTSCALVSSSSSANPVWMETLVVPFRPPLDDWSPESIQRCRDDIRINLFDQVVVPGEDDDGRLDTLTDPSGTGAQLRSFHHENYFLGGLCIPFTTLYHNSGALEATLRCEMPIEHLGYVNLKAADNSGDGSIGIGSPRSSADGDQTPRPQAAAAVANAATAEQDEGGVKRSSREATFLSLMMTLDPLLPLPLKTFDTAVASVGHDASESSKRLAQYASDWVAKTRSTNSATKRRNFDVFARSLTHGHAFLSQYVRAQAPPTTGVFAHAAPTLQSVVRFVQLVPFLDDWHLFDGEKDVWSTSQEFLEINAGDFEEHAVLLCNYFHWLDRREPNVRSYLVIGRAVPEGDGVYVLRQDAYKIPQRSVLWNASTGAGYHVWDDRCPLQDVSLVVSRDNVFANVQQAPRVRDLSWDIEGDAKAWKPFFHAAGLQKDQFALPSVQVRDLAYDETPPKLVERVETEIRETLKLEIRRWRSARGTTTFNIDAGIKLRQHLEALEQHMLGRTAEAQTANVLRDLQRARDVSGMPLNTTFTDLRKLVELVKNTVRCACATGAVGVGAQTHSLSTRCALEHPLERARGRRVCARCLRLRLPERRALGLGLLRLARA